MNISGDFRNFSSTSIEKYRSILGLRREEFLQDQLRAAKDSVQNMQRLHEFGQSQLFDLRTQSGVMLVPLLSRYNFLIYIYKTISCS